jgi:two-component system response regulator ChvI
MKQTVMIIDDDKVLLSELTEALEANGYQVRPFSDGKTALAAAPRIMPDIILLDLKMDKVSGFQVADKLNCSPKTENIPIIAMTGYFTQDEYSLITRICGMKKCINKPFKMEDIIAEVSKILAARDQISEPVKSGGEQYEKNEELDKIEK